MDAGFVEVMRNRRMLMQMAGLAKTPAERRVMREKRKAMRAAAALEASVVLVDKIRQREQGVAGMKAMPFAGVVKTDE